MNNPYSYGSVVLNPLEITYFESGAIGGVPWASWARNRSPVRSVDGRPCPRLIAVLWWARNWFQFTLEESILIFFELLKRIWTYEYFQKTNPTPSTSVHLKFCWALRGYKFGARSPVTGLREIDFWLTWPTAPLQSFQIWNMCFLRGLISQIRRNMGKPSKDFELLQFSSVIEGWERWKSTRYCFWSHRLKNRSRNLERSNTLLLYLTLSCTGSHAILDDLTVVSLAYGSFDSNTISFYANCKESTQEKSASVHRDSESFLNHNHSWSCFWIIHQILGAWSL